MGFTSWNLLGEGGACCSRDANILADGQKNKPENNGEERQRQPAATSHIKASRARRILMRPKAHSSTTPCHMQAAALRAHRPDALSSGPNHSRARSTRWAHQQQQTKRRSSSSSTARTAPAHFLRRRARLFAQVSLLCASRTAAGAAGAH